MKIWLAIITILCLLNFWVISNAYERIAWLTAEVLDHRAVINHNSDAITNNAGIVEDIIDYLNE